jgi:5'-deoxynucleotidase YfbR-like HD superfamily hydrolase
MSTLHERLVGQKEKRYDDLRGIKRFSAFPDIPHRLDLDAHSQQVSYLSRDLGRYIIGRGILVDLAKIAEEGLYHDDPEIITTDIPKSIKMRMSSDEKRNLQLAEDRANRTLAHRYFGLLPSKSRRQYKNYYKETSQKVTVEAKIVNIADKIVGLCETIHNIRCGADNLDSVLINYRELFESLHEREPDLMSHLNEGPFALSMDNIPTVEEARKFSKIQKWKSEQPKQLERSKRDFWKRVFDPKLPEFFRHWMLISIFQFIEPQLFPGWKEEVPKPSAITIFPLPKSE